MNDVTTIENTEELPPEPQNLPAKFDEQLAAYTPQLKAALPAHIPVERFKRVVVTAINQTPDLANADRRSLFNACVKAAQDGLLPDGREAALTIFSGKVQYMPMIAGIRKRMRNSGEVKSATAEVIYKNDHFKHHKGDEPRIEHEPTELGADPGPAIGAYAVIRLTNGEIIREVMSLKDIEAVRSVSRAQNSIMWTKFWGEGARKTVLRRCAKAAPISSDVDAVLRRDDDEHGFIEQALPPADMAQRPTLASANAAEPAQTTVGTVVDQPHALVDETGEEESRHATADDWSKALRAASAPVDGRLTKKAQAYLLNNLETYTALKDEIADDGVVTALDGRYAAIAKAAKPKPSEPVAETPAAPAPIVMPTKDGKVHQSAYVALVDDALAATKTKEAILERLTLEKANMAKILPGQRREIIGNSALARWIALGGEQAAYAAAAEQAMT